MRKLSDSFLKQLKNGYLSGITILAREDHDLNLEIRKDFINLYFKGHSLLTLSEKTRNGYSVRIHPKFKVNLDIPEVLSDLNSAKRFMDAVPYLKMNIQKISVHSIEAEYEQMIIRANNFETKSNSEYFVLDRQYVVDKNKFDLTGFFWKSHGRRKNQNVDMCLMEVKFGLNKDIANIDEQLSRYYYSMKPRAGYMAEEGETILKQKLELGMFDQSVARLSAMKTLKISRDFSRFQFILFLIDFNTYSKIFNIEKVKALPFANQIRIFTGGFAMWNQNTKPILEV